MICYHCGKDTLELKQDRFTWTDEHLGTFTVNYAEYDECSSCGEQAYPLITCLRMEKAEVKRLQAWLWKRFAEDEKRDENFITVQELAQMIGTTIQAVKKNPRLKNLVYQIVFRGETFYYKPSAELFRDTEDGRLKITEDK